MRFTRIQLACLGATMLALVGCASYPVVGNNTTSRNRVFGSFGLTGTGNNYTIESGSRLSYLKIAGDNNVVTVEDGAAVYKIEFWGRNNSVSLPYGIKPRLAQAGNGNQVIHRPMPQPPPRIEPLDSMDANGVPTESSEPPPASTPDEGAEP